MIKKVVYVAYQPLIEKVEKDFYIKELTKKNYEVEYWDLSAIFFPGTFTDGYNKEYIVKIDNFSTLNVYLAKQDILSTIFIILITFEARVLKLFRLLTKYNCYLVFFGRGALPMPVSSPMNSVFNKMDKVLNPALLYNFIKNKISYLYKKSGLVKPYDLIFNSGEFGINTVGIGAQIDKEQAVIININSFDYERYRQSQNDLQPENSKYIVFLDEYLPYHPDFAMLGIKTILDKNYYQNLNSFFKKIENEYNLEVIIAAHPKADNYKNKNPFENRKLFFNKTAELIAQCEFAIVHCSTSVSFAVLNEKPLYFIYDNDIKTIMPNLYQIIRYFSETLGGALVNINEDDINLILNKSIDQYKYKDYKYKYLTSYESSMNGSAQIFCDTISGL